MKVASPLYLLLIVVVAALFYWRRYHRQRVPLFFPNAGSLSQLEDMKTRVISKLRLYCRYLSLILIVLALAMPQGVSFSGKNQTEGIDILLLVDVSMSMNAEDLKPNRIEMAKTTVKSFVQKRKTDRLGLIVFGGDAFTKSPLTSDTKLLTQFLSEVKTGMTADGTAIGLAVATGLNRLKSSMAKSKVMILLTDGENNMGGIDPLTAARMAKNAGVKIYTIGVGKKGGAQVPIFDPNYGKRYLKDPITGKFYRTKLDETLLKEIAAITDGHYYRAKNNTALSAIYNKIDALEKTALNEAENHELKDYFPHLLWAIFGLLLIELLLANLVVVTVP